MANAEVLSRLQQLERAVIAGSEQLVQPSTASCAETAHSAATESGVPPLLMPHDGRVDEEDAYFDKLLEDFLQQGADLRGS